MYNVKIHFDLSSSRFCAFLVICFTSMYATNSVAYYHFYFSQYFFYFCFLKLSYGQMDSALIWCRVLWLLTHVYISIKHHHNQNTVMLQTSPKSPVLPICRHSVMVNFMCKLDWAMRCSNIYSKLFYVFLWGCFWRKLTFKLIDWVKLIALPNEVGLILSIKSLNRTKVGTSFNKREFCPSWWFLN